MSSGTPAHGIALPTLISFLEIHPRHTLKTPPEVCFLSDSDTYQSVSQD